MLLATVSPPPGVRSAQPTHAAVSDGGPWVLLDASDVSALVTEAHWRDRASAMLANASAGQRHDAPTLRFHNPLPQPRKVICCGLNYRDHILETGRQIPEFPTLFAKFADTLTGPDSDIHVHSSTRVDWEAELGVIVGAPLHRVDVKRAREGILGYTIANDISMRDWQSRTLQWFQGKAFDRTNPLGPVIVSADAIDPFAGLEVTCHINDEQVQHGNTRDLVFDAAHLISYVSQFTALSAGDLILSGTPGGVGLGMTPQRFLKDGDTVTTTIAGIGSLQNTIRFDTTSTSTESLQERTQS